jgi:hypothetical protein
MTLAPLIDMINHTPVSTENVAISRSEDGLEIRAKKKISKDDEIVFSYHSQPSRFWVCEYGFLLENNEFDDLDLTEEIEGVVQGRRALLEKMEYWGYAIVISLMKGLYHFKRRRSVLANTSCIEIDVS